MNLREFATWVYGAFTKLWKRVDTDEQIQCNDESDIANLKRRVAMLERQIDLIIGDNAALAELNRKLKSGTDALAESERKAV